MTTPSTPTGEALIARLEAAEVGSRELDALIWMELVECDRAPFRYWALVTEDTGHGEPRPGALYYAPHCAQVFVTPDVTTSIDAALALAERVLPGAEWRGGSGDGTRTRPWARLGPWTDPDATGATPALALVAAILKAHEASK